MCNQFQISAYTLAGQLRAGHFTSETLLFVQVDSAEVLASFTFALSPGGGISKIHVGSESLNVKDFEDLKQICDKCGTNMECWIEEAKRRL